MIDLETTGFAPGHDRVLEISVVRLDPGEAPRLAFDSLVNPCRPIEATEIHGIGEGDVAGAPRFGQIASEILDVLEGCVVAAYNVSFDAAFLSWELRNLGVAHDPPRLCVMSLRSLLGLGRRCRLGEACREAGIASDGAHIASADALAAAKLLRHLLPQLAARRLERFDDLAVRYRGGSRFLDTFDLDPLPAGGGPGPSWTGERCSRGGRAYPTAEGVRRAMQDYCDALAAALLDLDVTDEEVDALADERARLGLQPEQLRMLHGRLFAGALSRFSEDEWLDDIESERLQRLHRCLSRLGWAPGE